MVVELTRISEFLYLGDVTAQCFLYISLWDEICVYATGMLPAEQMQFLKVNQIYRFRCPFASSLGLVLFEYAAIAVV